MLEILGGIIVSAIMILLSGIKIVKEHDQLVVFRFGKLIESKGPGTHLVIPFIDQVETVDTRITTITTPILEELTQDHVSVHVAAACLFQIVDAKRMVSRIDDSHEAIEELAQTTLRAVISQHSMRQLVSERVKINAALKEKLDKQAKDWGIKIIAFELNEVEIPEEMKILLRDKSKDIQLSNSEI